MFNDDLLQKRIQRSHKSELDFLMNPISESLKIRAETLKFLSPKILWLDLDTLRLSYSLDTINNYDLISSFMNLHWVNDVKGYFADIYAQLAHGGAFQGCFVGGDSLLDIRHFFMQTELELFGKVYARFSPLIEAPMLIKLLSNGGFCDIVVDSERYDLEYQSFESMIHDIRSSGETNCLLTGTGYFPKKLYHEIKHRFDKNPITVNLEIIYWNCFKK